jgi:hypothetical protein
MGAPMVIHLYNSEGEVEKTFTQTFVPWKMLKAAVKLAATLNKDQPTEDDIDGITNLVVSTFQGKVTKDELDAGADLAEMMAVMRQIVATSKAINLNPTPPPEK